MHLSRSFQNFRRWVPHTSEFTAFLAGLEVSNGGISEHEVVLPEIIALTNLSRRYSFGSSSFGGALVALNNFVDEGNHIPLRPIQGSSPADLILN